MYISVISIGNFRGIRLTKTLMEKYNITDKVELVLEKEYIIIKPKKQPRKGWEKAFRTKNPASYETRQGSLIPA